jgi:uncharacterized protein (TIGR02266 family)
MYLSGQIENMPLLEVLQVIAYTQRSGLLTVEGPNARGTVLFDGGNIICTHSDSTLSLLIKAAKEPNSGSRQAMRRIQALVFLAELFDLKEGVFNFITTSEPIPELAGLDMRPFYTYGGLDTGDLLLVLAKAMDDEDEPPTPEVPPGENLRRHPRYKPIIFRADLADAHATMHGYLTDVSLGGAFFHAEQLPDVDCLVELQFFLPGEANPCRATAKVRWFRDGTTGGKRGVGVSFEEFPPESNERLAQYLDRFKKLAGSLKSD